MGKRVALVVAIAVLAGLGALAVATPRALGSSTMLDVADGTVFVRHGGAEVAAVDGQALAEGDEVRTGDGGRAVILFFDGSTLALEPATTVRIDAARVRERATIIDVYQAAGTTWHAVHRILDPGSRYQVTTPGMVAAVRGTAFQLTVGEEDDEVTTEEGTVEVTAQRQAVRVTPRLRTVVRHGSAPRAPERAPRSRTYLRVDLVGGSGAIVDGSRRAVGVLPDGTIRNTIPGARVERDGDVIHLFVPDATRDMRMVAGPGLSSIRYVVLDGAGQTLESGAEVPRSGPLREVLDQLKTPLPEAPVSPRTFTPTPATPTSTPATPEPRLTPPALPAASPSPGAIPMSPSLATPGRATPAPLRSP